MAQDAIELKKTKVNIFFKNRMEKSRQIYLYPTKKVAKLNQLWICFAKDEDFEVLKMLSNFLFWDEISKNERIPLIVQI